MIVPVYVDRDKKLIGFVSDAKDTATQLEELNNPSNTEFAKAAREQLNIPQAGQSDLIRAQYDKTSGTIIKTKAQEQQLEINGQKLDLCPIFLVTFDSLYAD